MRKGLMGLGVSALAAAWQTMRENGEAERFRRAWPDSSSHETSCKQDRFAFKFGYTERLWLQRLDASRAHSRSVKCNLLRNDHQTLADGRCCESAQPRQPCEAT